MNERIIKKILELAAKRTLRQRKFFEFTNGTNQSEWNISHHLANKINDILIKLKYDYDCDIEVIKSSFENKRPDIIFHRRGTTNNFLVIEVKRDDHDMLSDLNKIKYNWFSAPLSYKFGASIAIDDNKKVTVEVIKNNG